jgi:hypothetical protein
MANELVRTGNANIASPKKTSFNKIAQSWKQQFAEYLNDHPEENLLFVLKDVALNEKNSPLTRVKAASECLRFMVPQLMAIEVDAPDVAVLEEVQTLKSTLRTLLKKD